jgi:hypothetical protein
MSEREYRELVLATYDSEMLKGVLAPELLSPTPGNLKSAAVKVCEKRFDPKDLPVLDSFFSTQPDPASVLRAIQQSDYQIFKPLSNFLKKRQIETSFRNIQLLVWLIDFKPRPFHPGLAIPDQISIGQREIQPILGPVEKPDDPLKTAVTPGKPSLIIYSGIVVLLAFTCYFATIYITRSAIDKRGCMIWAGDNFEAISCNSKRGHVPILRFDSIRFDAFKKIDPDTITPRALGHVWYAKIHGEVEFYNRSGMHPVDTNKRLLKLSNHILNKYVFKTEVP